MKRVSTAITTSLEDGMVKTANFRAKGLVKRTVQIQFNTITDYNNFITWFTTNLNGGVDWFNWTDPISDTSKIARFENGELSDEVPLGGMRQYMRISATIETWG